MREPTTVRNNHTHILIHTIITDIIIGLDLLWLFSLSKTKDTDERNAFYYDWEDKRKIKTGADGDMKKTSFRSVSTIGKKTLASVYMAMH